MGSALLFLPLAAAPMTVGAGAAVAAAAAAVGFGAAAVGATESEVGGGLVGAAAVVGGGAFDGDWGAPHAARRSPAPEPTTTWMNARLLTALAPCCIVKTLSAPRSRRNEWQPIGNGIGNHVFTIVVNVVCALHVDRL